MREERRERQGGRCEPVGRQRITVRRREYGRRFRFGLGPLTSLIATLGCICSVRLSRGIGGGGNSSGGSTGSVGAFRRMFGVSVLGFRAALVVRIEHLSEALVLLSVVHILICCDLSAACAGKPHK